ncbi:DEAD/DEAH box helicase [Microbispora sp. CA-135349]|uniref:DEAD/DEAH box helicase n=1 Tax=Microbispora sp. CA-135349 TaxID=3239953 RepID=UPI003D9428AF
MAFKRVSSRAASYASPEALYHDLPRTPTAKPGLLLHQGDLLRTYAAEHLGTKDLALELPTGTGKTIPALVISEWWRRCRNARVVYACPTEQLTRQVAVTAAEEGIAAVVLTGSHRDWSLTNLARYESGEAVVLTTYSTVFNSSPKLDAHPDLLVFDDAHNGEQYVADQYCVRINRSGDDYADPEVYDKLLDILSPGLDGLLLQRLRSPSAEIGSFNNVHLVVPAQHDGMPERLADTLSALPRPWCFRYAMISDVLASCLVYITYWGIQIRPVIPCTENNRLFADAKQRLYLSATLGEAGDLERSFGRARIKRLTLPATSPEPRSGRRFVIFPDLMTGIDADTITRKIATRAGKALVLAPDSATAALTAKLISQPGWPVLTKDDVKHGMGPFSELDHAVCALASRYDGLDLPHEACRLVVMESVPDRDHLQERFLSSQVRAGAALSERVRTRVVQGMGRCTRGSTDWALVVVRGEDLTRYLLRQEVQRALSAELQAEIRFGIENSRDSTETNVQENVQVFLDQERTSEWREQAEPYLAQLRSELSRIPPDGSHALASAVAAEIEACALAGHSRWADASAQAQQVTHKLSYGGEATRGYRSFWLLLAGVWAYRAAVIGEDTGLMATAHQLIRQADRTSPGAWVRSLPPLPEMPANALLPQDDFAVGSVANLLSRIAPAKVEVRLADMVTSLAEVSHTAYEPALTELGVFLGAEAAKPQGSGRCDSNWCWGNHMWFSLEAKSEHTRPEGLVPHSDIRQVNDQLRILRSDRQHAVIPPGSITAIISPRVAVDPTGASGAEEHSYLVHPETILQMARDVANAWQAMLANRTGRDKSDLLRMVAKILSQYGVLPSQVLDRLTEHPISTVGSST